MRVLTFTNLYPNAVQPRHGIFVERKLLEMSKTGKVQSAVIAPVPYFPSSARAFGQWADYATVPEEDVRNGIRVIYPRFFTLPKIGFYFAPWMMARCSEAVLTRLLSTGFDFDLIDAHYFYPDGVAAAILGKKFGKPVVVTARGSDINVIPRYRLPRRLIRWAARRTAAIATVSDDLRTKVNEIVGGDHKVVVIGNGVDTDTFRLIDDTPVRNELGIREKRILLAVGNVVGIKRHDIALKALNFLPDTALVVVGEGPELERLKRLARRMRLGDRVHFVGYVPQDKLAYYYNACDALVLTSECEGRPNVVLEAMACGKPVIARNVGGVAELLTARHLGATVRDDNPENIATAFKKVMRCEVDRQAIREHSRNFSWDSSAKAQIDLFDAVISSQLGHDAIS